MGSKGEAEEEPLVSEGDQAAADPLIPGTGIPLLCHIESQPADIGETKLVLSFQGQAKN